jgi:hypothetical protein
LLHEGEHIATELVYSEAADPPSRCTQEVKHHCTIKWLKVPDFQNLKVHTAEDGRQFRELHYELRMRVEGPSLDFAIYYCDQRMASANVSFDFSGAATISLPKLTAGHS